MRFEDVPIGSFCVNVDVSAFVFFNPVSHRALEKTRVVGAFLTSSGRDEVKEDNLSALAEAWSEFIDAADRARLTPGEIREMTAALRDLPDGESFKVTVHSLHASAYARTVEVIY